MRLPLSLLHSIYQVQTSPSHLHFLFSTSQLPSSACLPRTHRSGFPARVHLHNMSAQEERIPEDDDTTEAPLTMAASVVLTNLPRDASKALETAGSLNVQKSLFSYSPSSHPASPPSSHPAPYILMSRLRPHILTSHLISPPLPSPLLTPRQ